MDTLTILVMVIEGLIAIILYMFKEKLKSIDVRFQKLEQDVKDAKKESSEIKFNYIARFEDIKEIISRFELKTEKTLIELSTLLKGQSTNNHHGGN